jgi:shikimate kinase
MPCHFDNMAYMNETGISVFLDVPVETLYRRMVTHGQADRPLFNVSDPELLSDLQKRCTDRFPFYKQANIIVSGETDAEYILRQLGQWL